MRIQISKHFVKDTQSIKDKRILNKIQQVLLQAQTADDLTNLDNLEEISGYQNYYRIKFDYRYRIGIFYTGESIEFLRVGSREDFYKRFP